MLKALDLRFSHDDAPLFDGLSLTLGARDRAALIGANGTGKSTLLGLLAGALAPERGTVARAPRARIGLLPQEPPGPRLTVDRLLGAALGEVWRLHGELERLANRLDEPAALARYGEAQERFGALGGWALQAELDTARAALGIAHLPLDAPLGRLSGGEAARALLAGVLLARPNVLLLDEPTNHLDADGLTWLEGWLAGFDGALLVVSHDRAFLDAVVTRVLELEDGTLTGYAGGYSAYREEKARRGAALALAYEAQQKRRRRLEADIHSTRGYAIRTERSAGGPGADKQKRYAKKVAHKAKARERRLRREMESERWIAKPRERGELRIGLDGGGGGKLVAALRGVDARVLYGVDLAIHGRDRIAVTGANGAGKSTLLALLAGTLAPSAGEVERPGRAVLLPQVPHALPLDATPLAYVRERSGAPESEARRLLGHFGLEGRAALRPLRTCSPGQRSRVAITAMVAARAELLLLDEPTNHLDLPTLEALEAALREHPGAIVAAGHDRAFLAGIGVTRRLEVSAGRLRPAR
ncbi:MAG TPA: ABC-F family ATP-binding cassette domain-containing protein [Solirubrobacteraceae bacterium]